MKPLSQYESYKSVRKSNPSAERNHKQKVRYIRQPKYKTRYGIDDFQPNE